MIVQVDAAASASGLGKTLVLMQESGELCDFTIVVSGSEVKAHKCVLAATCDYFKTSFSFSDFSQSLSRVDLTDVASDVKAVERVIQSLYTNEIDLEPSYVESILRLADYFLHDRLRLCIEKYMVSTVDFNTAVLYFQLAFQYRLLETGLISDIKWLLFFRFHDCFIFQQKAMESSIDVVTAFVTYNIFHQCSLLQVAEFMLNNTKMALERLHNHAVETHVDLAKEMNSRIYITFTKLSGLFEKVKPEVMEKWKPRLVHFMKTWRKANLSIEDDYDNELFWYVQGLELQLLGCITEIDCVCLKTGAYHTCYEKLLRSDFFRKNLVCALDSFTLLVCRNPNCDLLRKQSITVPEIVTDSRLTWGPCRCATAKVNLGKDDPENQIIPVAEPEKGPMMYWNKQLMTGVGNSSGSQVALSPDVPLLSSCSSSSMENECNILVVLAPQREMAAQLLATDETTDRRLVRSPKLVMSYYDIELGRWCSGPCLDMPVPGAMLERQSWRFAFFDCCLYMFSLSHEVGLQYSTLSHTWTHLECKKIFSAHGVNSPVKSVIPIKVGKKLIVMAMSRQSQSSGTFVTEQHFFEMQDDCRTFSKVASIQDDQLDMPVTQWTVSDQILITVKASSMVNGSLMHIQHIHVYNAETKKLCTHEAVCTMEAGAKIFFKNNVIYILNKDGWCRKYNFQTSSWAEMERYPSMVTSTMWKHGNEATYPALTHVSCHAGSSRWDVVSSQERVNSRMLEMMVTDDGNIKLLRHPSPPFQFMTAMCPSTMSRTLLDAMEQPHFLQVGNPMLDFTCSDQIL